MRGTEHKTIACVQHFRISAPVRGACWSLQRCYTSMLVWFYSLCKGTKVTVSSFLIQKLILKRIKVLREMIIQ